MMAIYSNLMGLLTMELFLLCYGSSAESVRQHISHIK